MPPKRFIPQSVQRATGKTGLENEKDQPIFNLKTTNKLENANDELVEWLLPLGITIDTITALKDDEWSSKAEVLAMEHGDVQALPITKGQKRLLWKIADNSPKERVSSPLPEEEQLDNDSNGDEGPSDLNPRVARPDPEKTLGVAESLAYAQHIATPDSEKQPSPSDYSPSKEEDIVPEETKPSAPLTPEELNVFVGALAHETTDQTFKEYFQQFGNLVSGTVMKSREGVPRGKYSTKITPFKE
jgi:hypothetical protein